MAPGRTLTVALAFVLGLVLGVFVDEQIQARGATESAKANILAAGNAVRENDLVTAMTHAHAVIITEPEAYDGYQVAGDVYAKQGFQVGARRMYEESLEKLRAGKERSMLVEAGVTTVEAAEAMLLKKIEATN